MTALVPTHPLPAHVDCDAEEPGQGRLSVPPESMTTIEGSGEGLGDHVGRVLLPDPPDGEAMNRCEVAIEDHLECLGFGE